MASTIITKTSEIADKTFAINQVVADGEHILIGTRDSNGENTKILLEIKAATNFEVRLVGTITDTEVI